MKTWNKFKICLVYWWSDFSVVVSISSSWLETSGCIVVVGSSGLTVATSHNDQSGAFQLLIKPTRNSLVREAVQLKMHDMCPSICLVLNIGHDHRDLVRSMTLETAQDKCDWRSSFISTDDSSCTTSLRKVLGNEAGTCMQNMSHFNYKILCTSYICF